MCGFIKQLFFLQIRCEVETKDGHSSWVVLCKGQQLTWMSIVNTAHYWCIVLCYGNQEGPGCLCGFLDCF